MIPEVELDIQVALNNKPARYVPSNESFVQWITTALVKAGYKKQNAIISLRIVEEEEIKELNSKYRNLDKSTNVLSFPYEALPDVDINLLGDIVVCAAVVESEALEQSKTVEQHWAHMIIHGVLHLIGYDHIEEHQAVEMETLEIDILANLGIPDPYGELNTP